MTDFVLIHGAFRGGWSWDRVRPLLEDAGHRVHAPTLSIDAYRLDDWVAQVDAVLAAAEVRQAVLAGHSQGGVVVREVAARSPERIAALVYLDAAVPDPGERAVDVAPTPPDEAALPAREVQIPARPLAPGGDLDEATAAWINERLAPTPFGPSLDPVSAAEPTARATYAFCAATPEHYPSGTTRRRLDERGVGYHLIEAGHDAPLTNPEAVAALLLRAVAEHNKETEA